MSQDVVQPAAENLVVAVENTHQANCGPAPRRIKQRDDQTYLGFFENPRGDQFTVEIDRQAKKGVVRSGNPHWSKTVEIRQNRLPGDVLFGVEEFVWLTACWAAATGEALEYPDNFA